MNKKIDSYLGSIGFLKEVELFFRDETHVSFLVWFDPPSKNGRRIHLGIELNDPFRESEEHAVAIHAMLFPGRVELFVDSESPEYRWSDVDDSISAFGSFGMEWLNGFLDFDHIISHFEAPKKNTWNRVKYPPVYDYYLSLVYFHREEFSRSIDHLNLWLEFLERKKIKPEGEPRRTLNQLGAASQRLLKKK